MARSTGNHRVYALISQSVGMLHLSTFFFLTMYVCNNIKMLNSYISIVRQRKNLSP